MNLGPAKELLDEALLRLARANHPGVDLVATEAAFADALGHLYGALRAEEAMAARRRLSEAVAGIDAAVAILERTGGTNGFAEPLALLGRARAELTTASVGTPAPEPRREALASLRATLAEPRTLEWARGPIRPALPLPEPAAPMVPPLVPAELEAAEDAVAMPTSPAALAELLARSAALVPQEPSEEPPPEPEPAVEPPPPAEPAHFGTQQSEEAFVFERVRSCMEDLATLCMMRTPLEGQTWTGRGEAERRLLTRVDALVAAGEAYFPKLVKLLERPLPDPGLWWATLFFFGSLAGQDALDQTLRLARLAPLDDAEVRAAVADALALAPHPGLSEALLPWVRADEAARRFVAVSALARRGPIGADVLMLCARDGDESVVEAAARALSRAEGGASPALLRMLLFRPEEGVVRAALETAFRGRSRQGFSRARALCEEGRADFAGAACFVAAGSEGKDELELLLAAAGAKSPSRQAVKALGGLGDLRAVEPLLVLLEDKAMAADAALALQRLTGASLVEDGDPPDEVPLADPPPFAVGYVAPELAGLLTADPQRWGRWWELHRARAKAKVRYFEGHPWTPEDALGVMERPESSREDRVLASLELHVRTGLSSLFDPAAFVAAQRRQLDAWRLLLNDRGARPGGAGAWPTKWEH